MATSLHPPSSPTHLLPCPLYVRSHHSLNHRVCLPSSAPVELVVKAAGPGRADVEGELELTSSSLRSFSCLSQDELKALGNKAFAAKNYEEAIEQFSKVRIILKAVDRRCRPR